jgi:4-hydroxy-3-methylbut-2-enyl diphosphate reductase
LPDLPRATPVGLVAQTTQTQEVFRQVELAARDRFADAVAISTICKDTELRQQEGTRLAEQAELVVVVGGRSSANTCRLASLCRGIQPRTVHVECADELDELSFPETGPIGLISGASTPDWIIKEVCEYLTSRITKEAKST